jgi:hypothetical protein
MKVDGERLNFPIYKLPKHFFAVGPEALIEGTTEKELHKYFNAFFQ